MEALEVGRVVAAEREGSRAAAEIRLHAADGAEVALAVGGELAEHEELAEAGVAEDAGRCGLGAGKVEAVLGARAGLDGVVELRRVAGHAEAPDAGPPLDGASKEGFAERVFARDLAGAHARAGAHVGRAVEARRAEARHDGVAGQHAGREAFSETVGKI